MKNLVVTMVMVLAVVFALGGCKDVTGSMPIAPPSNGGSVTGSPEGLTASHGKKASIELSWDEFPSAAVYYIASADSPDGTFTKCAETPNNSYTFRDVAPGSNIYYRVTAKLRNNKESRQSQWIMGSSLATPSVSVDEASVSESSNTITWFMDNAINDTYLANLAYVVYCYEKGSDTEIKKIEKDASELTENKVVFDGLSANTKYEYVVEAYLKHDKESSFEKSRKMDGETSRRLTPGAPKDLNVSQGRHKGRIEVSFELPEEVDIALGEGQFEDKKPLYFTISKRLRGGNGINNYVVVNSKFAPMPYVKGDTVAWIDDTNVAPGTEYEYEVRSFVEGGNNNPETSKTSSYGWALAQGDLSIIEPQYEKNAAGDSYEKASLQLNFAFDPKGINYKYVIHETHVPINYYGEIASNVSEHRKTTYEKEHHLAINEHVFEMHALDAQHNDSGRGLYSYAVEILLDNEKLDTVKAVDQIEITGDTDPIKVDDFFVQDGYKDRFVIKWANASNIKYVLYQSGDAGDTKNWELVKTFNENPTDSANKTVAENFSVKIASAEAVTKYFKIEPFRSRGDGNFKQGQAAFSKAAQTMGVPELTQVYGRSYDTLTVEWKDAQKADTYKVSYQYEGGDWKEASGTLTPVNGDWQYKFMPEGYGDPAQAGKKINVQVKALNTSLTPPQGSSEIATDSESASARLVGPAELNLSASKATSVTDITVSWDKVEGANGYYVIRRQFDMNNASEIGADAIMYYVRENGVTGKALDSTNGFNEDTETVTAALEFNGSKYTLKDVSMSDNDYNGTYSQYWGTYKKQQNEMAWGYSYRYYVVPVINETDNPEARLASPVQNGFTFGFGQNVAATKGTYASSGNVNDGIKITWAAPPNRGGVSYVVYRRAYNEGEWKQVTSGTATEYVDNPARLIAYEYVVGINGSKPQDSVRFINESKAKLDDKGRPNMIGFMLDLVRMNNVSRDWKESNGYYAEEVNWYSAGVANSVSSDTNWGIDGYEIFVLNQNIDAGWHSIASVTDIPNQTNQSAMVTNAMGGGGLLKVMRDYHHYFKVRSYVLNGDQKIYCPDPGYTWSNGGQNDYVKWGARQIGGDEFIRIATLHLALGLQEVNGTAWNTGYFGRTANASGTNTQGSVKADSNFGVTDWTIDYRNYRDDIQLRNGQWITFLTLNGKIRPFTNASNQYPQRYGYFEPVTITGPSDTPGLYTGTFRFGTGGDLYWNSGTVTINYPTAGSGERTIQWLGQNTAMPYSGQGNNRHDQGDWR